MFCGLFRNDKGFILVTEEDKKFHYQLISKQWRRFDEIYITSTRRYAADSDLNNQYKRVKNTETFCGCRVDDDHVNNGLIIYDVEDKSRYILIFRDKEYLCCRTSFDETLILDKIFLPSTFNNWERKNPGPYVSLEFDVLRNDNNPFSDLPCVYFDDVYWRHASYDDGIETLSETQHINVMVPNSCVSYVRSYYELLEQTQQATIENETPDDSNKTL